MHRKQPVYVTNRYSILLFDRQSSAQQHFHTTRKFLLHERTEPVTMLILLVVLASCVLIDVRNVAAAADWNNISLSIDDDNATESYSYCGVEQFAVGGAAEFDFDCVSMEDLTLLDVENLLDPSNEWSPCRVLSGSFSDNSCGPCAIDRVAFGNNGDNDCVDIVDITWDNYKRRFNPIYRDVESESDVIRLLNLMKSALLIAAINNNNSTSTPKHYRLGFTPLSADFSAEDYRARSGYIYQNLTGTPDELETFDANKYKYRQTGSRRGLQSFSLPTRVDWHRDGGTTQVKDQGRCGCCWAVSLTGAIEGGVFANPDNQNYLQSLSFQQLISCSKANDGCDGGNPALASISTIVTAGSGLASLNDYPYTDYYGRSTDDCLKNDFPPVVQIQNVQIVVGYDARLTHAQRLVAFKQALALQPISVVMRSSCRTLSNYRSGVLTEDGNCACLDSDCTDHSVVMVGYDDTAPIPYFKLKNSWGTRWGEEGYFRVSQAPAGETEFGLFGILTEGTIVTGSNTTFMVEDELQKRPRLWWLWGLLIALMTSACIICACMYKKKKGDEDEI